MAKLGSDTFALSNLAIGELDHHLGRQLWLCLLISRHHHHVLSWVFGKLVAPSPHPARTSPPDLSPLLALQQVASPGRHLLRWLDGHDYYRHHDCPLRPG